VKGQDEILAAMQSFWKAFPKSKLEPQVVLADGRYQVGALVLIHGTQTGAMATPSGELPATGAVAGTLGIVLVEYDEEGRITRETQYLDAGQILRQLARDPGARPPITAGVASPVRPRAGNAPRPAYAYTGRLVHAFNYRDWDKMKAEMLDLKIVMHDMSRPADLDGADAVIAVAKDLVKAASAARLTLTTTQVVGDYALIELELTGTNDGPWPSLTNSPTGKPFSLHIAQLLRFAEGRVVEGWQVANGVALMQQLGVKPPMQPPK
jgi:steroid delta-isomerase-like uncharacterized protein